MGRNQHFLSIGGVRGVQAAGGLTSKRNTSRLSASVILTIKTTQSKGLLPQIPSHCYKAVFVCKDFARKKPQFIPENEVTAP